MKIREIMSRDVLVASHDDTIEKAAILRHKILGTASLCGRAVV